MKISRFIKLILFCSALNLYSQENIDIDSDSFIIGTFSNFSRDYHTKKGKNTIDNYFPYEKPLVEFILPYLKNNYSENVLIHTKESGHSDISSPELESHFNILLKDGFDENLFIEKNKKLSFLTGVFLRYGEKLSENLYVFRLPNHPKYSTISIKFLSQLKVSKIAYQYLNNIPNQHNVYFFTTPEIEKYFSTIKNENEALRKSFFDLVIGKYSKNYEKQKQEYEKYLKKEKENALNFLENK